jgi:hypothetical protein
MSIQWRSDACSRHAALTPVCCRQTSTGKSTLLLNLIAQDLAAR